MRNFINCILTAFVWCSVLSCTVNTVYSNRDTDKRDAEKVINQFYESLKGNQYQKAYGFFSEEFYKVTDTPRLDYIFSTTLDQFGKVEDFTIEYLETQAFVGTKPGTTYVIVCNVRRGKFPTQEKIKLKKEKGDVIRIISYYINRAER